MIHPKRDSLIALILTLAGLAAFAWGLSRLLELGENDVPGSIAAAIGGLVAFLCSLVLLNFRWALRLTRRMERGEGLIARWTVPAETVTAYVATEAAIPWIDRSRWRPKPGQSAEILFSNDAVLAGGRYQALSAKGLQTFKAVNWIPGTPNLIEFPLQEITTTSAHNYSAGKFVLRVPVPADSDDAAWKVLNHFRSALTQQKRANPQFWRARLRVGLWALAIGVLVAAVGIALAQQGRWRGDDTQGAVALILVIVGVMTGVFGIGLALIAGSGVRRG